MSLIWSSISPTLHAYVQDENDPSDMWTTLIAYLDIAQNEYGALLLRQQFHNEQYKDGEAIETYIARITDYQSRLPSTRRALSDHDVMFRLIMGPST